jgi:predicted DNA-binding protein
MRGSWWHQLNDFLRGWRAARRTRVTARLPADLVAKVDRIAVILNRSRTDVVEDALELYLEQADDLMLALDRLKTPARPLSNGKRSSGREPGTD